MLSVASAGGLRSLFDFGEEVSVSVSDSGLADHAEVVGDGCGGAVDSRR